jgi:hypothetical protein
MLNSAQRKWSTDVLSLGGPRLASLKYLLVSWSSR